MSDNLDKVIGFKEFLLLIPEFLDAKSIISLLLTNWNIYHAITSSTLTAKKLFLQYQQNDQENTTICFNILSNFNCSFANAFKRIFPYNSATICMHGPVYPQLLKFTRKIVRQAEVNKRLLQDLILYNNEAAPQGIQIVDINCCISNLNRYFYYDKWKHIIKLNKYAYIAGGSIISAVSNKNTKNQDIDIYLTDHTKISEFLQLFKKLTRHQIFYHTKSVYNNTFLKVIDLYINFTNNETLATVVTWTRDAISYINQHEPYWTKFQIIYHSSVSSISQVLHLFDLDVCQIAFDGHQFHTTHAFIQAIQTRSMIHYNINPYAYGNTHRIQKYQKKFHYNLLLPRKFDYKLLTSKLPTAIYFAQSRTNRLVELNLIKKPQFWSDETFAYVQGLNKYITCKKKEVLKWNSNLDKTSFDLLDHFEILKNFYRNKQK